MRKQKSKLEDMEILNSFGYRVVLPVVAQEGELTLLELKAMSPTLGDMEVVSEETRYILAWQNVQVSYVAVVTRRLSDRLLGTHVRVSKDTPREFREVAERLARSLHKN